MRGEEKTGPEHKININITNKLEMIRDIIREESRIRTLRAIGAGLLYSFSVINIATSNKFEPYSVFATLVTIVGGTYVTYSVLRSRSRIKDLKNLELKYRARLVENNT